MRKVIAGLISSITGRTITDDNYYEAFQSGEFKMPKGRDGAILLISFIFIEILVLFFGKWLWNKVVRRLINGVNPATSIWQILGFSILIKLMTN